MKHIKSTDYNISQGGRSEAELRFSCPHAHTTHTHLIPHTPHPTLARVSYPTYVFPQLWLGVCVWDTVTIPDWESGSMLGIPGAGTGWWGRLRRGHRWYHLDLVTPLSQCGKCSPLQALAELREVIPSRAGAVCPSFVQSVRCWVELHPPKGVLKSHPRDLWTRPQSEVGSL